MTIYVVYEVYNDPDMWYEPVIDLEKAINYFSTKEEAEKWVDNHYSKIMNHGNPNITDVIVKPLTNSTDVIDDLEDLYCSAADVTFKGNIDNPMNIDVYITTGARHDDEDISTWNEKDNIKRTGAQFTIPICIKSRTQLIEYARNLIKSKNRSKD